MVIVQVSENQISQMSQKTTSTLTMAAQQKNALSLMGVDSLYLLSLRKAIAVASASTAIMMQDCSLDRFREYVIHAREHKELEIALKSTEMALFLKVGTNMKPSAQVRLCYKLLDTDGEGICASKLTEAMQKIKDTSVTGGMMAIAEEATRYDSKDGAGIFTLDDLERFLTRLQTELECTFGEVCQLCVSIVAFGNITDGRSVLEEMIAQNCREHREEDFENSVTRARLILVFQMMDIQQSGMYIISSSPDTHHPMNSIPHQSLQDKFHSGEWSNIYFVLLKDTSGTVSTFFS